MSRATSLTSARWLIAAAIVEANEIPASEVNPLNNPNCPGDAEFSQVESQAESSATLKGFQ